MRRPAAGKIPALPVAAAGSPNGGRGASLAPAGGLQGTVGHAGSGTPPLQDSFVNAKLVFNGAIRKRGASQCARGSTA